MGDESDLSLFFQSWASYRSVVDHDAMEHREIFAAVHDLLTQRADGYSLLDLGCGDASAIEPAMTATGLRRYVGVDLAEPALELAERELANVDADVELRQGDIMSEIASTGEAFDVILASFALHHIPDDGKREFLAAAHRRLRPGGQLILIDVVRLDGETRPGYLERFTRYVHTWPIPAADQERVIDHVTSSDFPAEYSAQPAWASELGFRVAEFYRGGNDTQAGWVMTAV